jgi:hypothetical protein
MSGQDDHAPVMKLRHLATLVCVCSAVLLTGCIENMASRHATIADAKADIERGWIPSVLPDSTVKIREEHDLDTNTGHGTFEFGAKGEIEFKAVLTPLPVGERVRLPGVPREKMEHDGYHFYRHGEFNLAIDWKRRMGEFWLSPE